MSSGNAAEQEILDLEDRRYQAMLSADIGTLEELCADELVYTHSNAERDSKASYLDKVRSGHFDYHWIEHPVESIYVNSGCAVLTGQMRASVTNGGVAKQLDNSCLAVWAHTDAGWRFVAYSPTPNKPAVQ